MQIIFVLSILLLLSDINISLFASVVFAYLTFSVAVLPFQYPNIRLFFTS